MIYHRTSIVTGLVHVRLSIEYSDGLQIDNFMTSAEEES
jgi:hypothetical protein